MQRAANTTIEETVFSMWFAYIHCGATDVFSMDPPQDYTSSPVVELSSSGNQNENGASPRRSKRRVRSKIDCELL
jgi:hypothetical protein